MIIRLIVPTPLTYFGIGIHICKKSAFRSSFQCQLEKTVILMNDILSHGINYNQCGSIYMHDKSTLHGQDPENIDVLQLSFRLISGHVDAPAC